MTSKLEMLDHALQYAARGWPVFKIAPGTKKPYPGSHGFKDAATHEIIVNRMWDEHPDADIAFATGKVADAWVLDIDGEEGSRNLTKLEAELGPLPETLEQRSASGGRHLFFNWPAGGLEVRNKQALKYNGVEHKGVDVRGEGGYVVLAPSGHPNGHNYSWPYGQDTLIADVPAAWLDAIAPARQTRLAPWEKPIETVPAPRPVAPGATPILDRARKYLAECEPAVQGQGGHDKLLWAARAMVVGFQLDDAMAISLLWDCYNPRCVPPWHMGNSSERRDFERKVSEVRRTPGEKPSGWLLDEYGLRSENDAMADIIAGNRIANALLANHTAKVGAAEGNESVPKASCDAGQPDGDVVSSAPPVAGESVTVSTTRSVEHDGHSEQAPFPTDALPPLLADYCRRAAEAHVVDESLVGLAMLAVAGAAMGNAWRLELKEGFIVPPALWVAVVGRSGSNKTAPLNAVVEPLRKPVPIEAVENAMLNPQGRIVVSNATVEAVIARLAENPRGLLCYCNELAGWVKGFNAYRKGGGADEQAWLEFWDANGYQLDRKTNNEQVFIPAASVAVLGGIQPLIFAQCFDPAKFASGLVPRLLVTMPAPRPMRWTETTISGITQAVWDDVVQWLRSRPFAGLDSDTGRYRPHMLTLTPEAKEAYVRFYNSVDDFVGSIGSEHADALASKSRITAGRVALILHGTVLATGTRQMTGQVGIHAMTGAVRVTQWCLEEQLRVFGLSSQRFVDRRLDEVANWMRARGGLTTVRDFHRSHNKRYANAEQARADLNRLVASGKARREGKEYALTE